eukprot:m.18698 g.18698  ORF g.18698 m.18698 type:complete len:86 (+) comp7926_c0_seq1:926-1183(+)
MVKISSVTATSVLVPIFLSQHDLPKGSAAVTEWQCKQVGSGPTKNKAVCLLAMGLTRQIGWSKSHTRLKRGLTCSYNDVGAFQVN